MLVEKSSKEALEYYIKGKPVTALWIGEDGGMNAMPLSDILDRPENHFLVDVPAVVNPDFEQAVQEMTGTDQVDPEEIIQAVYETQESITPPTEPEERMEEETIDLPADNIEDKKEKIRKLVEEGYTNREIADQTGIPFGTVGYHAARFRKKEKEPVDNSDRHLCKTCKFRSKEFLDNDELDIYLQRYTIFDNPFLPQEFVEQLCKEYEGTIYYDRLILGLWKRAEGAIYKRFADDPEKFRCEVLEGPADNPEHKQFRKNDIVSIEIGLDFGGNQSGHSFVARGYTDDYRDVIGIMSKRVMAKDQGEDIDSNMLDQLFCDFVQEVIDKYGVIVKHGDYVEYCNVESVYYDNAETVLGNSIRNAVEKRFPWIIVRKAKKASIIDRIRCTVRLMGAGRFWITEDCKSLQTALSDAVWNKDVKDKDERLDDGSTDIDSLDAFEYTIERDMRDLIEEVENV